MLEYHISYCFAECRYAECSYSDCHGAIKKVWNKRFSLKSSQEQILYITKDLSRKKEYITEKILQTHLNLLFTVYSNGIVYGKLLKMGW
jgi:hypothetical protein